MELKRVYLNDILALNGCVCITEIKKKSPFSMVAECNITLGELKLNALCRTFKNGGGYLMHMNRYPGCDRLQEEINNSCDLEKNPTFFIRVMKRLFFSTTFVILAGILFLQGAAIFTLPIRYALSLPIPYTGIELLIKGVAILGGMLALYGHHAGSALL